MSDDARQCPFCDFVAHSTAAEVAHMETRHREIVAQRLADAGFNAPTFGDDLRVEVERLRAGAALARVELDTAIAMRGESEHNVWLCIERARAAVADDALRESDAPALAMALLAVLRDIEAVEVLLARKAGCECDVRVTFERNTWPPVWEIVHEDSCPLRTTGGAHGAVV